MCFGGSGARPSELRAEATPSSGRAPRRRTPHDHPQRTALSPYRLASALAAALVLAIGGASSPLVAIAAPVAADLSPDQQGLLQQATGYLQDLKSVTGRFSQTDPSGQTSTGVLYLQRPGKARFEYNPPSGLLVVSDGHFVGVSDTRLKTFGEYPLDRTPLALLLAREVRLDRGAVVTAVDETPDGFSITAHDRRGQAEGRLTLLFRSEPLALRGWNLTDAQGRLTQVRLGALTPDAHPAAGLFYIRDPRH